MKFGKRFAMILAFVLSFSLVEASAFAGMISTTQAVADLQRTQNMQKVRAFLDRSEVQNELVKQGLSPEEAKSRVASLSDAELQRVAGNIDNAPAGAEPVVVIGLGTLLIVVLLILLLRR